MSHNAESDALVPGQKCPMSGEVVTGIPHDDWIEGRPYTCHVCGTSTTYRVRETDYAGGARLHSHKVTVPATRCRAGRSVGPDPDAFRCGNYTTDPSGRCYMHRVTSPGLDQS